MYKLLVVGVVCLSIPAFATSIDGPKKQFVNSAKTANVEPVEAPTSAQTYGGYTIKTDMSAIPSLIASENREKTNLNGYAIVQSTVSAPKIGIYQNSVLQNRLTGTYAIATGNIIAVMKDTRQIANIESEFNVKVELPLSGGNIVFIESNSGDDMVKLIENLRKSGYFKSLKIDLSENINTTY